MQSLYCPECQEYLETSSGEMANCSCGWTQPEDEEETPHCSMCSKNNPCPDCLYESIHGHSYSLNYY